MREVLARKLERAKDFDRVVEGDPDAMIDHVVSLCRQLGYVDDTLYAKALVQSEHRRGRPARVIRQKLREKGVPTDIADAALELHAARSADPDLVAAHLYAKRRRLGQYRLKEVAKDAARDRARKDLASMARAGFSYGTAKKALEDALEEGLDDGAL